MRCGAARRGSARASLLVVSRTRAACSGGADTLRFAPLSSRALNAPALKDALLVLGDGGDSQRAESLRAQPSVKRPLQSTPTSRFLFFSGFVALLVPLRCCWSSRTASLRGGFQPSVRARRGGRRCRGAGWGSNGGRCILSNGSRRQPGSAPHSTSGRVPPRHDAGGKNELRCGSGGLGDASGVAESLGLEGPLVLGHREQDARELARESHRGDAFATASGDAQGPLLKRFALWIAPA